MKPICPHCKQSMSSIEVDDINLTVLRIPRWKGAVFSCPHCRKILNAQINPISVSHDTTNAILRQYPASRRPGACEWPTVPGREGSVRRSGAENSREVHRSGLPGGIGLCSVVPRFQRSRRRRLQDHDIPSANCRKQTTPGGDKAQH